MKNKDRWNLCADDYIDSLIENGEGDKEGFAEKALRILLNPFYLKSLKEAEDDCTNRIKV